MLKSEFFILATIGTDPAVLPPGAGSGLPVFAGFVWTGFAVLCLWILGKGMRRGGKIFLGTKDFVLSFLFWLPAVAALALDLAMPAAFIAVSLLAANLAAAFMNNKKVPFFAVCAGLFRSAAAAGFALLLYWIILSV